MKPKVFFDLAVLALWMLALVFSVKAGAENYRSLSAAAGEYQTVLLDSELSSQDYSRIKEEEEALTESWPFVLWKESSGEAITAPGLSKSGTAVVIRAAGDLSLLFHGSQSLSEEDKTGCLISEGLAVELFGSTQVTDLPLTLQEKEYQIRGTFKEEQPLFVCIPARQEAATFSSLSLPSAVEPSEFLVRHSLSGKKLNFTILKSGASISLFLLPLAVTALLVYAFLKKALSLKNPSSLLYLGLIAVLLLCFFLISRKILYLPKDMIPDKWSDFSFWPRWWETTQADFLFLIQSAKGTFETSRILSFFRCILLNILSQLLAFFCWRKIEHFSKRG